MSKSDKKANEAAVPAAAPVRPPPKKPRVVGINDIVVDGVSPVNDAFVAAPVLSEQHMYDLEGRVKESCRQQLAVMQAAKQTAKVDGSRPPSATSNAPISAAATDAFGSATFSTKGSTLMSPPMAPPARSPGRGASPSGPQVSHIIGSLNALPKRSERFTFSAAAVSGNSGEMPQLNSKAYHDLVASSKAEKLLTEKYVPEDANILRLIAFYKVIHSTSLRVHEEISRNLRINIADLALVERVLFETWEKENDMASLLALAALPTPAMLGKLGASFSASIALSGSASVAMPVDSVQKVLPPVSLLVMFLWTCDAADLMELFSGEHDLPKSSAVTAGVGGNVVMTAKTLLLVNRVKEKLAKAKLMAISGQSDASSGAALGGATSTGPEDFSRGQRTLQELRYAIQNRKSAYLLNKWAGTLSVFLGTLHQVHIITCPPPLADPQASSVANMSSLSAAGASPSSPLKVDGTPRPRPDSGRSAKSSSSLQSDSDANRLVLRCRLQYDSTADALKALEMMATYNPEGYPLPLPPLLSFTSSTALLPPTPATQIRRHEDYVQPNLDVDEEGTLRSFESKIRVLCEGCYVAPKPSPEDTTLPAVGAAPSPVVAQKKGPQEPPTPSNNKPPTPQKGKKRGGTPGSGADLVPITSENEALYISMLPKYITVELVVEHATDHVIDLRSFCTHHPHDEEFILPPFVQVRYHAIVPEQLKLCVRLINTPPLYPRSGDAVVSTASSFFERALADGRKASAVSNRICTRLVNQFVKPHHCHRHPTQTYVGFCHDCRSLTCAACAKETHAAHRVDGISHVCHHLTQTVIMPKVTVLQRRAELLRQLLGKLDGKSSVMHRVVDSGIDDVKERICRRRALLHEDIDARGLKQSSQLKAEQERLVATIEDTKAKLAELSKVRSGVVPHDAITWKRFLPRQVLDHLHPLLPTRQVCSLISVLTWSNPSKYLIHVVYPPDAIVAVTRPSHAAAHDGDASAHNKDLSSVSGAFLKSAETGCQLSLAESASTCSDAAEDNARDVVVKQLGSVGRDIATLLPLTASRFASGNVSLGYACTAEASAPHTPPVWSLIGKQAWMAQNKSAQKARRAEDAFGFFSTQRALEEAAQRVRDNAARVVRREVVAAKKSQVSKQQLEKLSPRSFSSLS